MTWLYRYEAKSIQRWILGTDRLVELQGGSTLVEGLEELARQALPASARWLYGGAGSGTATFPDRETLAWFAGSWPMLVSRVAPGLELVQAWSDRGDLGEIRERLGRARNRPPPDLPEVGPWVARSGRSGLPAVARDPEGGLLDAGARARADAGANTEDTLGAKMLAGARHAPPEGLCWQRDLQAYPADEGVAVVHADGNRLGERIHRMDAGALAAFSVALRDASWVAARAATNALWQVDGWDERPARVDGRRALNGRPVVAGGDDFTMIVRGRAALPVAYAWLTAFERETARLSGGKLTACAGVTWVRRGFPFHQAHQLAEALCRGSKVAFAEDPGAGSRLSFARVTTAISEEAGDAPSWTLPELERLAQLTAGVVAFRARGKLRDWTAERDEAAAELHWARIAQVASEDEPGAWSELEARLGPFAARKREAVQAALQWSRVQPGSLQDRLGGREA